jgi:tubulin-specific chaperone C
MHDSRGTRVFLSCSSRPIIENSQGIEFAVIPGVIRDVLEMGQEREEWLENELVEDFNWLRRDHSPNWRILGETEDDIDWERMLRMVTEGSSSRERILELVLK